MKTNELTYVMTEDEFKTALVAGAIRENVLPPELEGSTPSIQYVANGVILSFGPMPLKEELPAKPAKQEEVPRGYPEPPSTISPETVKKVLSEVMERVPRINTIANWSEEQRAQAMAWAERWKSGVMSFRPDFIIEPAVRGSKKAQVEETPKTEPPKRGRRPVVQTSETRPIVQSDEHDESTVDEPDPSSFFEDDGEPSDDAQEGRP